MVTLKKKTLIKRANAYVAGVIACLLEAHAGEIEEVDTETTRVAFKDLTRITFRQVDGDVEIRFDVSKVTIDVVVALIGSLYFGDEDDTEAKYATLRRLMEKRFDAAEREFIRQYFSVSGAG